MDLSASGTGRGKISEQEKAASLGEGRCLYCGLVGHMARNCPHKSRNPFRAAFTHMEGDPNPNAFANPNMNTFANPNTNSFANPFSGSGGGENRGGGGTRGQDQSGNA